MLFYVKQGDKEHKVRVESRDNDTYVSWNDEPEEKMDFAFHGNDCYFINRNRVFHANVVGTKTEFTVWRPKAMVPLTVESEYKRIVGKLRKQDLSNESNIYAKMPGKISKVSTKEGAEVEKGSPLLVMEAMKMENEIRANCAGTVTKMHVAEGQAVETGSLLIEITPATAD
jgi:biotin carboxyl carrier protein